VIALLNLTMQEEKNVYSKTFNGMSDLRERRFHLRDIAPMSRKFTRISLDPKSSSVLYSPAMGEFMVGSIEKSHGTVCTIRLSKIDPTLESDVPQLAQELDALAVTLNKSFDVRFLISVTRIVTKGAHSL
jgi:hypothetical protein